MRNLSVALLLLLPFAPGAAFAQADAPTTAVAPAGPIQIALPFNKAIVRETVPVKLRDFPAAGYVSISIDGQFITAQSSPKDRTAPVFVWDTKASYTTADDPNTPKYYADGPHAITIAVYDAQSKLVGKDTVQVQLANKINLPDSQGIKLAYPWSLNTRLTYQRRTDLVATPSDAPQGTAGQSLQESLLRYRRTVENATGGTFLVRDEALPVDKSVRPKPFVSYVSTHGTTQSLQAGYAVRASYRVVNSQGRVLSTVGAQNGGDQLGFSIPILPPRRVSAGEHWEAPVQMTLDWTSPYPTTVTATSTLEDFEWQDRYPTAKIRETYTGPAKFAPRPGSPLPFIQAQDIKFERIIYFAYNAARIVRMQTTLTLTTTTPGLLYTPAGPLGGPGAFGSPGMGGSPGGYPGMGGSPGGYPGTGGSSYPGMGGSPGGYPGMGGGQTSSYPGMPGGYPGATGSGSRRRPRRGSSPGGSPGGYPGMGGSSSGYPGMGGTPGAYPGEPGGVSAAPVPTKLKYTETSVIIL